MMKVDGDGMRDLHVIFHASQKQEDEDQNADNNQNGDLPIAHC